MGDTQGSKRKPANDGQNSSKRSKGGNSGQWQTPHHRAKLASRQEQGVSVQPGDQGIWVTCVRGKESRATSEFQQLCDEYGELMYGIAAPSEEVISEDEDGDIESSIQKELDGMKNAPDNSKPKRAFKAIQVRFDCLFFMRTRHPVDPVEFAQKMCEDAELCTNPKERKSRFLNRLWPVSVVDKASDTGVERAARQALAPHFDLKSENEGQEGQEEVGQAATNDDEQRPAYSYAIRHSIRANNSLNRDALIKQVAALVGPRHKVNLSSPDKVVLVDICQNICGVCVVDGKAWDRLKRFNLSELCKPTPKPTKKEGKSETQEADEVEPSG